MTLWSANFLKYCKVLGLNNAVFLNTRYILVIWKSWLITIESCQAQVKSKH